MQRKRVCYSFVHMNEHLHEGLPQQEWKEPAERAKQEAETRPARLEKLRTLVSELFPGEGLEKLRSEIERSFHVPQWGDYHNEGMLMDRHFEEILNTLARVEKGDIPEEVPEAERALLQEMAIKHHDALQKYVFLHDISKADLIHVETLPAAGQKKDTPWEGTLEQWCQEHNVSPEELIDPEKLYKRLSEANLKGFSYYNSGVDMPHMGRKTEKANHGEDGKEKLDAYGYTGVAPVVLTAIEYHEVAFQFTEVIDPKTKKVEPEKDAGVRAKKYKENFGELTPEERGLALTASFIDTMASWRKNGKPDLGDFLRLIASKHNYELIQSVENAIPMADPDGKLDKKKVDAFVSGLTNHGKRLLESQADLLFRMLRECKPTVYRPAAMRPLLDALVASSELTPAEAEEIITLAQASDIPSIGKKFGKKMRLITPVLEAGGKEE